MPSITSISIQTKNKNRCNIFVDGEFVCGVSMETVFKNRLKVGTQIDSARLVELVNESEKSEALTKALDYISSRLKTKRQIKEYLVGKGYSDEVAWYVVDKLKSYNYVNDEEYSKRYIETTSKTQGRRLVEYKLMMRGVKKEDISSAFLNTEIDSRGNALGLAKKHIKNKEINNENLSKTYRYLIGKGFSYDDANYAVDKLKEGD